MPEPRRASATSAPGGEPADPRAVLARPAPPPDAVLRYGDHPEHVADLRLPAGRHTGPARPLVIVVHGGFWRAEFDRRHTGPLAAELADRGYPVAQLEYRRTGQPGGGWPGTLDDVATGIAALPALVEAALAAPTRTEAAPEARAGAARTEAAPALTEPAPVEAVSSAGRVAPGPPILLGHSAGGHLALWAAQRAPAGVRGVLALAPVLDLAEAYRLDLDGGAVAALLGGGPEDVPERYAVADPARSAAPPTRIAIVHGTLDRQVPVQPSRRYAAEARRSGADLRFVELPEAEHFGVIDPLSRAWPAVLAELHWLAG